VPPVIRKDLAVISASLNLNRNIVACYKF
jgi:hypothetical protein